MLERFERAMSLGGVCFRVLMLDKELLLFPVLSLLGLAGVLGGIFGPAWLSGDLQVFLQSVAESENPESDPRMLIVSFLAYFLSYFVMIFFNAGLLACVMIRFAGGDPTVMDGLRASMRSLPQIFAWALFASSIGFLISFVESRLKGLARFMTSLVGAAWAIATYFAVPALVVDRVGPIEAVMRSASAIRKTWGEALISQAGLAALHWISVIGGVLLAGSGMVLFDDSQEVAFMFWTLAFLWVLLASLVISTLNAILKAALYIYAVEGVVPENFDERTIRGVFDRENGS